MWRRHCSFAGLFDATAIDGEFPAMIAAADAVFLDPPIIERSAAVYASRVEKTGAAAAIAEQNQILAQHPDLARRIRRIRNQPHRMPIAPEQLSPWRAPAHQGQFLDNGWIWPSICRDLAGHHTLCVRDRAPDREAQVIVRHSLAARSGPARPKQFNMLSFLPQVVRAASGPAIRLEIT